MKKTAKTSEISTKSKFIKDMFAMIFANGVSFLISALITFIVPKILNIENYSYVQLYIFYTSYISYLHYGWVDGIRLRYGGAYYDKLDKPLFSSQIRFYSIIQFIVSFLVLMLVFANNFDGNRLVALVCICVCMFIRLPRLMPQYILEMSNRMQECARITIIERTSSISELVNPIFFNSFSKFVLLFISLFSSKELIIIFDSCYI